MSRLRLGIMGGTFDPPHIGHLVVAEDVAEALDLHEVIFVPSGVPPHKADRPVTPAAVRYRMVQAAVESNDRFRTSDVEVRRDGPSYSVDTLREMGEQFTGADLYFIMGADQFADFHSWRDPEEVGRLARIVVMARSGEDPGELNPRVDVPFEVVPVTRIDISSSEIRRRVHAGASVRYLVRKPVRRIIAQEGLYRDS